jgi:hypothetical protein
LMWVIIAVIVGVLILVAIVGTRQRRQKRLQTAAEQIGGAHYNSAGPSSGYGQDVPQAPKPPQFGPGSSEPDPVRDIF